MSSDVTEPRIPVDCATAREAMEIAAVEPGGLGRLMAPPPTHPTTGGPVAAGVTADGPTAADTTAGETRPPEPLIPGVPDTTVAAHVTACAGCSAELARLREIAALLGDAIAPEPPADLRARTLAFVAEVGRDRGAAGLADAGPEWIAAAAPTAPPASPVAQAPAEASSIVSFAAIGGGSSPRATPSLQPRTRGVAVRVLALAAAFVLAIGGTALVVGSIARSDAAAERSRNAALAATAESALRLMADPTAIHIPMRDGVDGVDGVGSAVGMAVVAPVTYDATVVAVGLPEPPTGHEYACYIVIDGQRVLVGRMADGGRTYAWAGTIAALSGAAQGSVGGYGVLLVPVGSTSTEGTPVLSGSL